MPIDSVTANPLIAPVPTYIRMIAVISVVTFASNTAENARLYPRSTEVRRFLPPAISSRIRSNTRTFASTAMPMVRMMPAMPGSVSVALNAAIAPSTRTMLSPSAQTAITPARR